MYGPGPTDPQLSAVASFLARPVSRRRFTGIALGAAAAGATVSWAGPSSYARADGPNLLTNPSFDEVTGSTPTGWTVVSGAVSSVTDPVHSTGGRAVRLDDPDPEGGVLLRSAPAPVEAGLLYEASVWVLPVSGKADLYLEFWDAAGVRIAVQFTTSSGTSWQQLTQPGLSPEGAVTASVLCYQSVRNEGVAVFDDAALVESTGGEIETFPLLTPGHPRLYFTADEVPRLKARAADTSPLLSGGSGAELWAAIEQQATTHLTETSFTVGYVGGVSITYQLPPVMPEPHDPPPGYNGAYPYWTAMGSGIRSRLEAMSLAWVVTGDQRYAVRLKEYLLALAEWPTWSDPAFNRRAYLDTAHLVTGIAFAYDVVCDEFTAEERARVVAAIDANGMVECWSANLTPADHNIAMLQVAALGAAAAALHGEHDQTDKYLTLVMRNFAWYLEQRRTTGDQEGFLYTSFSMDNILVAADQIARVTGVEGLLADPYVSEANADGGPNLVHWMLAGLVPGGSALAPISDSAATRYFPVTSEVLAGRDGGEHAAWYLKQGSSTASVTNRFLYGSPDAEVEAPDLPLQGVDAASGWAHARSGWTAQDTLMIMVGNDSQVGHNHYDQNTILLGTNNQWIMSDPGYRDYIPGPGNVFTVSDGHTGITVDGKTQDRLGGSVMTSGVQSDGASYFTSDATAAYAGLGMSKVVRRVVALPDQYFYVLDELEAPQAHSYGWQMFNGNGATHAVDGRALAIGGSDTGSAISLRTSQAQLVVSFAGDDHTFALANYDGAATYGPLTTVTNGPAATTGTFAAVLQAAPYDLPGITQAEAMLDRATSSEGVGTKVLGIGGASLVFLRSVEAGHFVSFPFAVDTAGNHDIRVWLGMSPAYGTVQVSVDGTDVGEPYDCWTTASSGLTEAIDLGSVDLSSGEHTITFTAVAKNPSSSGWFLSVDAWQVTPTGEPVEAPLIEPVGLTDLVAANGRGARITRGDVTDVIGIRLAGTAALDLGGVRTDGDQFLVSTGDDGSIERIALSTGTSLTVGGRVLVAAGDVIDLGVRYAEDGAATVQLRATAATTVRVHQARPASVELNGERVRGRVDGRGRTVEVAVPAGESRLSWG